MFDTSPPPTDHALMQDSAFATALTLCGGTPLRLPSGLLLLARSVVGVPILMLPRAAPPADLHAQLTQAGVARRPLILSPEQPCAMPRAVRISPPRSLLSLDLRTSKETRRAALHQKWRNQLRRAENSALRLRIRPLSPDHPVLDLETDQARTRRYQNWPPALTAAFVQAAPAQTLLFTALLRGYEVAHMLFLTHGTRATYHIGHTTDAGRSSHAHNLILWEAMQHLHAAGITRLDLGPQTTQQIDRFKCRAGAKVQSTGGTWLRWAVLG
ncbi:GNAT family N-acetyltransferase [uncultured Sulfitobacter sp.]|uniref:GNAT family N-acetyltransferase n=1 Tax=uncultured Sulfitobacter sp. TaxID=191468 RepID=UPI002622E7CA|nr:GNAT family N-acetyltransferase [uncultured Sulfitobacter sp.]